MSEPRGWREHPLVQLTLVRYREFFREPEAVFWVFVFPVLLTAGLGIAFRNQAPERAPVAVVEREAAASQAVLGALSGSPDLLPTLQSESRGGRSAAHRASGAGGGARRCGEPSRVSFR